MNVLVTGGTGLLGQALLPLLDDVNVRTLSRSARGGTAVEGDLATGEGLEQAVDGVDTIVHLASLPHKGRKTAEVDVAGTRRLLTAAKEAGTGHVVFVSIVGVDRAPFGYFGHKLAAEDVVRQSGIGWSILRATPFHQWIDGVVIPILAKLPVIPVDPAMPWQPVDTGDVAQRLKEMIAEEPSGAIEEFAGPQVLTMDHLVTQWKTARGSRKPLLRLPYPGRASARQRKGYFNGPARGTITWTEFLNK